jgi:hypothetical protein
MATRRSTLPDLVDTSAAALQSWARSVKEVVGLLTGDSARTAEARLDSAVTFRDLIDNGFASRGGTGSGQLVLPEYPPSSGGTVTPIQPPAPTGLTATGAFGVIILDWDAPVYAGHAYTEIFRATIDDLGAAIAVGITTGFVYSDWVGDDVQYYYWIRSVSVTDSEGPFNALSGTAAQTAPDPAYLMDVLSVGSAPFYYLAAPTVVNGVLVPAGTYIRRSFIAEATIGTLQVENAAITDLKVADAAITELKVANGAITRLKVGNAAIGTLQVENGAITQLKVGDLAISSGKLLIGAPGAALNLDPAMADPTAWASFSGYQVPTFATVSDGKVGNTVARSSLPGELDWINEAKAIPVDPSKTYRFRCWARTISGSGSILYAGVGLFDSAGANIGGDGTQWYYAASGVAPPAGWTEYVGTFGAGTPRTLPSNARSMRPLVALSYGGGTSVHEIQDVRIEEMLPSTLIQDGSIVTNKLAALAVKAGNIDVVSLSAIKANLGEVTAGIARSSDSKTFLDLDNKFLRFQNGAKMLVSGVDFGSSGQFVQWYGNQQVTLASCEEANALFFLKDDGTGQFAGRVRGEFEPKAWCCVYGEGTPAFKDRFNCASVTKNGTGQYRITFTLAQPNANYACVTGGSDPSKVVILTVAAQTKTYVDIECNKRGDGGYIDISILNIVIFGSNVPDGDNVATPGGGYYGGGTIGGGNNPGWNIV